MRRAWVAALAAVAVLGLLWHTLALPLGQADALEWQLFYDFRLPRVLGAAACGALLSLCGLVMQCVFRNPLAEPALMGVSGGGALGAAAALSAGAALWGVELAAFVGAAAALAAVAGLARHRGPAQLILTGVAVNALCAGLLSLLLTFSTESQMRGISFWLMGSLSALGWRETLLLSGCLATVWALLLPARGFLHHSLFGEAAAFYAGYTVNPWRWGMLALSALGAAAVAAQTGSIGFIALMAPHLCRLAWGGRIGRLLWQSPLIGALLCVLADDIGKSAAYPSEIPIGVITSLAGVPFFILLLRQGGGHASE